MKIRSLILLATLFLPQIITGQVKLSTDFKIKVSEPYKVVDARNKEYFGDGATYCFR